MAVRSLKQARLFSFAVHGGLAAMIILLLATHNWMIAFPGILVALFGFAASSNAARCPKCSRSLFEGGRGIDGVFNLFRLSGGASISCSNCAYRVAAADYK